MFQVFKNSWALLLGMMLLMADNGLQGSLLGIRGAEQGFSPFMMSIMMSAYFLGFKGCGAGARRAAEAPGRTWG